MKRSDFSVLPNSYPDTDFLYVVERSDGALKVGTTSNARVRMESLFDHLRRKGFGVSGAYLAKTEAHKFHAERRLIQLMGTIGQRVAGHREWFTGVDPKAAAALVVICAQAA